MRIIGLIGSLIIVAWGGISFLFPDLAQGLTFLKLIPIERTVVLCIGILSVIFSIVGKGKWMVFLGLLAYIAICYKLAFSYLTLNHLVQRMAAEGPDAVDNVENTLDSFKYLWGWGILVVGPVLIIGAGGLGNQDDS